MLLIRFDDWLQVLSLWSCWSGKRSASAAHALLKLLALVGSHVLPAFFHAVLPVPAVASAVPMEAAKENFAENDKADCLPERDHVPAEDLWDQGIPQSFDNEAEHRHGNETDQKYFGYLCCFMGIHLCLLTYLQNLRESIAVCV